MSRLGDNKSGYFDPEELKTFKDMQKKLSYNAIEIAGAFNPTE